MDSILPEQINKNLPTPLVPAKYIYNLEQRIYQQSKRIKKLEKFIENIKNPIYQKMLKIL
jgi:hypothetical protein